MSDPRSKYIAHRFWGKELGTAEVGELKRTFLNKFKGGEYHREWRSIDAAVRIWVDVVEEFRMRELVRLDEQFPESSSEDNNG